MSRIQTSAGRLVVVAWLLMAAAQLDAETLSPRLEKRIRSATFEVVVALPKADPLTYEKPLPMELVPFALRGAEHLPVGTAFCIGPNRYVSAAHVLASAAGSQYGAPALRDQAGKIYEIGQIIKYASAEDFALFSLREPPKTEVLATDRSTPLNSPVFAVGNALGDGVIIRDGLFTSTTPEDLEGRWNWMRFSAAASPGNSGGPLLDVQGRVIGVIVAKSPNENLNFALPIDRILAAPAGAARLEGRTSFSLPFAPESVVFNSSETFQLPLSYDQFADAMVGAVGRNFDRARTDLLKANADNWFPMGKDSIELLHSQYVAREARLVVKKDGKWDAREADDTESVDLGRNGSAVGGNIADVGTMRIWLPDDVKVADLVADSRRFMDLFLKATPLSRYVGPEAVRITSLGTAMEDGVFIDSYGRKWLRRVWRLPFADFQLISLALPIPDGFLVLTRTGPTAMAYPLTEILKAASDLAYISYTGSLDRWNEYLAMASLKPTIFSGIHIEFETDKYFRYRSPRLELGIGTDLQNINGNSVLGLNFSYMRDKDAVVWDVAGVSVQERPKKPTMVYVRRHPRPPESLGQDFQETWTNLRSRRKPYDGGAFVRDRTMVVATSVSGVPDVSGQISPAAEIIYEAGYVVDAPFGADLMRSMRQSLLKGIRVIEK